MKMLTAGPARLVYENGFLRRINYGNSEVVRMIYFALRDHNWNTLSHDITSEEIENQGNAFRISYESSHHDGGVAVMAWKTQIAGTEDGTITFEIRGRMLSDFRKNRAGFCLLHPPFVAGSSCTIEHADGATSENTFPVHVAPENPFKNIRSMTWTVGANRFLVMFEGDVFETEDQRNWGDASYKTFCTPLDLPFPVELKKGSEIFQRIILRPVEPVPASVSDDGTLVLQSTGMRGVLPALGIGASTETERLTDRMVTMIRELRLTHYRIDLQPSSEQFAADFSREYENAYALGLPLEVALHLTEKFADEIEAFSVICQQNKVRLKKVILLRDGALVTSQDIIDRVTSLKETFPRVQFGGGTDYNFTEINRNHFQADNLDFISFSMDPQEHATDDLTILENAASLEFLVASTKSIYGSKMPVQVSPLTLLRRFNPYATNPADLVVAEARRVDPRQKDVLTSLWTLGAICSLAKGSASSTTLYQTVGNQGVIDKDCNPYPVYDTIRILSPFQGRAIEVLSSRDPLSVTAALLDKKLLIMANMTTKEMRVQWNGREFALPARDIRLEKVQS